MGSIEHGQLLYHLTSLSNLSSILQLGLLTRAELNPELFEDVADGGILEKRKKLGLDYQVPFHFFANNPFDGRVQVEHQGKPFIIISVRREIAERENWHIVPRHPLSHEDIQLFDYLEGIGQIDWASMERRDYHDSQSKCVCMAECLAPGKVEPALFSTIWCKDEETKQQVDALLTETKYTPRVTVNQWMFLKQHGEL
ncbi:DUF4433 domain-containing protein [Serratia quinivorans]|uniref:DUF4433 domain-containing protein n=1 Tax=Serratia quinivorans TaxID=137545 RepID=UPI0021775C58|nr:DUF4433 domain-containing protein [Serratia quinivorans]CAI1136561.1 Uncharacterised protein [Serratia quinivorans]CAI1884601.1 Uncharacterised protein [Serratia quinivorans]